MIEKCANTIADWLINCEVVKETDKELYSCLLYTSSGMYFHCGILLCLY